MNRNCDTMRMAYIENSFYRICSEKAFRIAIITIPCWHFKFFAHWYNIGDLFNFAVIKRWLFLRLGRTSLQNKQLWFAFRVIKFHSNEQFQNRMTFLVKCVFTSTQYFFCLSVILNIFRFSSTPWVFSQSLKAISSEEKGK